MNHISISDAYHECLETLFELIQRGKEEFIQVFKVNKLINVVELVLNNYIGLMNKKLHINNETDIVI